MTATNSGVTLEAGFTYTNQFLFYSRSELEDSSGEVTATGQNCILMDMNSIVWVAKSKIAHLGRAIYSYVATLPIANNFLSSDAEGAISGGDGGFADSYYQRSSSADSPNAPTSVSTMVFSSPPVHNSSNRARRPNYLARCIKTDDPMIGSRIALPVQRLVHGELVTKIPSTFVPIGSLPSQETLPRG